MDCARNIITANFSGGGTSATTAPLWQWDYGQVLCITGIDLPAAFEVHFSTNRSGGVSTTAVGADGQVTIPSVLLTIGKNLNAWIYLSDSEGEGETEYSILIPVKARPMPETYDAEVSGEFDDVVRQVSEYAETAQTAADNAGASASAAAASADSAAASASAAETAKTAAETAQGNAEDAQATAETAAQTATEKAQQTAQDAAQAAQSKVDAESAADRAEAAQTGAESAKADAETAAQSAADSASAASASATSAGQAATSAGQSATAAAGSATTAGNAAQTATTKAAEAFASADAAAASETAAQTAQTAAETAATNAGQSASTATTKAAEAAQSASNAAASETAAEAAATRAETAAASLVVDDALSETSENPVQNKVITGEVTQVKSALEQKVDKYHEEEITGISLDKFEIVPTYYGITTYANTPAVQFSSFYGSGKTWIWSKLKNDYSDVYFKVHYGMFNASSPNTRLVLAANDTNALAILLNGASLNANRYTDSTAYTATAYSRNTNCRDIAADDTLHCVKDGSKVAVYLVDNGAEVPLFSNEYIDILSFWASANFTEDEIGFGLVSNNSGRDEILLYDFSATVSVGEDFVTRDELIEEIRPIQENEIGKNVYLPKNLLDISTMSDGYIDASGNIHSGGGLKATDFIPVFGNYVYCYNPVYSQYFAYYDENKTPVATYSTLDAMTRVYGTDLVFKSAIPNGAAYFRCTYYAPIISVAWISLTAEKPYEETFYSVDKVYPETVNPLNPCDYSELSIRAFHKIACIGDSITYGGMNYSVPSGGVSPVNTDLSVWYSYPTKLKAITGIETTNFGTSGLDSEQWYAAYQNTDFSGYDCAVVHLGINDSAHHISDEATTTAIGNIIAMLKAASKDIRIFVCNVIAAYDGEGYQAKGNLIMNYAASLNDPYVIPLDLSQYTHVRPSTSYVAGHLTALGYYMMAYDLARYISWYIDHNKRDFQFVQFIGTDAVYP